MEDVLTGLLVICIKRLLISLHKEGRRRNSLVSSGIEKQLTSGGGRQLCTSELCSRQDTLITAEQSCLKGAKSAKNSSSKSEKQSKAQKKKVKKSKKRERKKTFVGS